MIIHREIGSSYHHKPMVQGVDYSPLMMESNLEALVKEERRPETIPAVVPPLIFLLAATCSPTFVYFLSPLCCGTGTPRGPFILSIIGQDVENETNMDDIGRSRANRAWVARSHFLTAPPGLLCSLLTSSRPTLARWMRLEICEPWPLTLPFFKSRSSWKVKNTNIRFFCQTD